MQVIPAIDTLDGAVVRLTQGDFDKVSRFSDDPPAIAGGFVAEGATLVHVVDLAAARSGAGVPSLWRSMGDAGIPFQAAGGIRNAAHARQALDFGAVRVVTGTTAVWDPIGLAGMVTEAGDRLVAAIDVRDGRAVGRGWTETGRPLEPVLDRVREAGVSLLMVTSVTADGMLLGPDLGLIRSVASRPGVRLIASGGIATLDDVRAVAASGAEAAVIGRALYEGRFTLTEAMAAAR